jgi:hypothetical protein
VSLRSRNLFGKHIVEIQARISKFKHETFSLLLPVLFLL